MGQPHPKPTPEQLQRAYRRLRARGGRWADDFDAAMADTLCRGLIECQARGLAMEDAQRAAMQAAAAAPHRPAPMPAPPHPAPAAGPQQRMPRLPADAFDARRAAANDRDDD